ncbi:MAG: cytochrome P450 [Alphaproteobacteria bacterium]|nr:cytochrome P450 [Alphaproteobacteria bacterium]
MNLPPGPSAPRLVQTWRHFFRVPSVYGDAWRRYGSPFTARMVGMDMVMLTEPEQLRALFNPQEHRLRRTRYQDIQGQALGPESLLMLDGARHAHHRRLLTGPFRPDRMQRYGGRTVEIVRRHAGQWPRGRWFSAYGPLEHMAMELILYAVFGLQDPAACAEARTLLDPVVGAPPLLLFSKALQVDLGHWSPWGRFLRNRERLNAWVDGLIAERRAQLEAGERHNDILSQLLEAEEPDGHAFSDLALRCELLTLLATGHETTAVSVTWALGWVLRHPSVHQRLRDELAACDTPEDINDLPYLDMVCKEVLRISPVLPIMGREVVEPFEIDGYTLQPGTQITALGWFIHRRPEVFPDPERFDPERFVDGARFDRFEYLPFGTGARACVGRAFGLYQMKVTLGTLLKEINPEPAPDEPWPALRWRNVVVLPKGGCQIRL